MNKVIIMGRLTADPELKQTSSGVNVCNITVAVDRSYVAQGKEREADFIPVVLWRQQAEFVCKYFAKGKMIAVEGSMRVRSYNDTRYPDVKHYVTEVYADSVYFTGDKTPGVGGGGQGGYQNQGNYGGQQIPPPPQLQQTPEPVISIGDLGDFEEVIGDDEGLPF